MTDKELLACAIEFDMGPEPLLMGKYIIENVPWWERYPYDAVRHRISIRRMAGPDTPDRWAIFQCGNHCLAKTGRFEYQPTNSSRTEAFFKRCRYASLEVAVAYYQAWRDGQY